jgi:RNA-directed DNA polymerase
MSAAVNTEAILDMQRKLYRWSRQDPHRVFADLFNVVCDRRTLELAWKGLAANQGSNTPGSDGMTRKRIEERPGGYQAFLDQTRTELRDGTYRPQPVRQRLIPKPGKPGLYRPLGIPTLKDRLVQKALKTVLEPIFEADFYPTSYGFRSGRCTHDAVGRLVRLLHPTANGPSRFALVIEGDIKGCFDAIDHHVLLERIRLRIGDRKVLRLIRQFLKAGILVEGSIRNSVTGTPQGGIISPLLANIYLTELDARYRRWTPGPEPNSDAGARDRRKRDQRKGLPAYYLVRYADDFVILVAGIREDALREKDALAAFLRDRLKMELSHEKTLVTDATDGFEFLGYRVVSEKSAKAGHRVGKPYIPKGKLKHLRARIKSITARSHCQRSLANLLKELNPLVRGWRNYYRHAVGASKEFGTLDWWLWRRVFRWLCKKHRGTSTHLLRKRYRGVAPGNRLWGEGGQILATFLDGGTRPYRDRGTNIPSRWDDDVPKLRINAKAHRHILNALNSYLGSAPPAAG